MGEHDDDLETSPAGETSDPAHVAAAVASGLEQIAAALEAGLREVAAAIRSAVAKRGRRRDAGRSVARPRRTRKS